MNTASISGIAQTNTLTQKTSLRSSISRLEDVLQTATRISDHACGLCANLGSGGATGEDASVAPVPSGVVNELDMLTSNIIDRLALAENRLNELFELVG